MPCSTSCNFARVPGASLSSAVAGRLGLFFLRDATMSFQTGSLVSNCSNSLSRFWALGDDECALPEAAVFWLASRVARVCRRLHSFTSHVQALDLSYLSAIR